MKRGFIILVTFTLLLLLGAFILLPSQIAVQQSAVSSASTKSSYRCLTENSMIQKWWQTSRTSPDANGNLSFIDHEWQYRVRPLMYNGVQVDMSSKDEKVQSIIVLTALGQDSTILEWKAEWPKTANPIERLQQYWMARKVKQNMAKILQQFSGFVNSPEKLYGLDIKKTRVTDTLIVTKKKVLKNYPTTEDYYSLIEDLQQYVEASGVQVTNYPMLNIQSLNSNEYGFMVGLPVNKVVPETKDIHLKRMIPGNILVTEVTGGVFRIEHAMNEMHYYIQENGLLPPAIPFQSLITDRKAEPDTSRWVTKLYFPVY